MDTSWQSAESNAMNMNGDKLSELDVAIPTEYSNIHGIVVVRNGAIAYERYYQGYTRENTQHVTSVTKSILSALIGIAIDVGYIESVEQRVLDFFPEYQVSPDANPQKHDITVRHLLTMTAPYPFADWQEPLDKLCMQDDWVKYTLDILGEQGSIGTFKYSTSGAHLLSAIITRATGQSAREFANERLFRLLGMREVPDYEMEAFGFDELFGPKVRGWVKDRMGNSTGGWGLTLTPRDMARFGQLYLHEGAWNNQQIVSKEWIQNSTTLNPNHYGYLWWLREEDGVFAHMAMGDGGNAICCIPDKQLVVAIASGFIPNPQERWKLIKEHILPACN